MVLKLLDEDRGARGTVRGTKFDVPVVSGNLGGGRGLLWSWPCTRARLLEDVETDEAEEGGRDGGEAAFRDMRTEPPLKSRQSVRQLLAPPAATARFVRRLCWR